MDKKNKNIEDSVNLSDSIVATVIRGATNRIFTHVDTENPTDSEKINKLFEQYLNNYNEDLLGYIVKEVKKFNNRLYDKSGLFYRGLSVYNKSNIVGNKIGPPLKPRSNRYNDETELALYLIDAKEFLPQEINSRKILLQRYEIPIDEIKIADISPENENISNNLSILFDICESGITPTGLNIKNCLKVIGKSEYFISQFIAKRFKNIGWDGLYIPGVHGSKDQHYHNLCIFYPALTNWDMWVLGDYEQIEL